MIGKKIQNFEFISILGNGGMGIVYLAKQMPIDRDVAIKVLDQSLSVNPQFKDRFLNEASVLAKLNHPNIVSIFDFIEQDGQYFIVMEYVQGMTLDKLIEGSKGLDSETSLNIFTQALDGFSYAHKRSVVHRDIKPSNMILNDDSTLKILDFGIAKLLMSNSNLTRTGTRMGSISYMSPEQVMGRELDLKTDIYSLGVTLYEMLSGKLPFDSNTDSDYIVQNKIVNEPLPDLKRILPDIPDHIASAINIATQKNPADRFEDCDSFKNFLNGVQIQPSAQKQLKPNSKPLNNSTIIEERTTNQPTVILQDPVKNQVHRDNGKKKIHLALVFAAILVFAVLFYSLYQSADEDSANDNSKESKNPITSSSGSDQSSAGNNNNRISSEEFQDLNNFVDNVISSQSSKDNNLGRFYAENVSYYKGGIISSQKVLQDKQKFFAKWDKIEMRMEGFDAQKLENNKFILTFDKYFNIENINNGKYMNGKVQSRWIVGKSNGTYKILTEQDDKQYYLNKSN